MSEQNKKRNTRDKHKEDGKFHSKNIKHNSQNESARAAFGLNNANEDNKRDDKV